MSRRFPSGSAAILTASGSVAGTDGAEVYAFGLAAGPASCALATLIDSKDGNSGSNRWTLTTSACNSANAHFGFGIWCASGVYVYLVGTAACASVAWRK